MMCSLLLVPRYAIGIDPNMQSKQVFTSSSDSLDRTFWALSSNVCIFEMEAPLVRARWKALTVGDWGTEPCGASEDLLPWPGVKVFEEPGAWADGAGPPGPKMRLALRSDVADGESAFPLPGFESKRTVRGVAPASS